jgi:hypothetical protein
MSATERRQKRSSDPSQAIRHQLEVCRQKAGLDALILADRDGLCIAFSGPATACEEFAARVSLVSTLSTPSMPHRGTSGFDTEIWTEDDRWDVHVRRFDVDGFELCLCAVGGVAGERAVEVERSLRGVTRILAA